MRLSEFIDREVEKIIAESVQYAATLPVLDGQAISILRDHLPLVLDAIARDLEQPQTREQSIAKSQGHGPTLGAETAAETHGALRANNGLTIEQVVAEYRVLRSCVLRLWSEAPGRGSHIEQDALRFNEAIDQAVAESVAFHASETERWRQIFLGVLGHDLRGPINAMALTAEVLAYPQSAGEIADHASSILRNTQRLSALLDSLLEYNKSKLGVGMAIQRSNVNLGLASREEVELLRRALPHASIVFDASGDTTGRFDGSRVREALANLVFNAAQHGTAGTPVSVAVRGQGQTVEVSTENESDPIPQEVLQTLFEPLRRYSKKVTPKGSRRNLGLGLFIVREIARAHGGDVKVTMKDRRVIFKMVLPRVVSAS